MVRVSRSLERAVRARASRLPRARCPPPAVDFNLLVLKSFYQSDYFNFFAVK